MDAWLRRFVYKICLDTARRKGGPVRGLSRPEHPLTSVSASFGRCPPNCTVPIPSDIIRSATARQLAVQREIAMMAGVESAAPPRHFVENVAHVP